MNIAMDPSSFAMSESHSASSIGTRSRATSSIYPETPALSINSPSGPRRRTGRIFRSTKIDPDTYKARTPWHQTRQGKSTLRRTRWTCLGTSLIGVLGAGALLATGYMSVPNHKYRLVLDEQFNGNSLDTSLWSHEIQVGGFGNKQFEMTTSATKNSFVEDGFLYIVPTLSNETYGDEAIINGYTLNLTADGTCTSALSSDCVAFSNTTRGNYSVLPPIESARLTTKLSHSIKYGKVEVSARMPTGDWIWPAIWMLPKDNVYGKWPLSGEIDIVETKGNAVKNSWDTTANTVTSTLHWGLDYATDMYRKTLKYRKVKRDFTNEAFYKYGLNWDPNGMRMWQSKPSRAINSIDFSEPFWKRGNLANALVNNTHPSNPWISSENVNAAPFDQDFYLILSVAVGGTNGWFPDDVDKPWSNGSPTPARDFWLNRNAWLPSWPSDPKKRGMSIDYVKIWRLAEPGETCAA
ncbi:hypothetical protein JCM10908_007316 [Rhodotorula pacifica]|uniref:uncharacterized protein n=1 Tax=Rhodotorula pacifica TaxID=1495444 RepID=UPI0031805F76